MTALKAEYQSKSSVMVKVLMPDVRSARVMHTPKVLTNSQRIIRTDITTCGPMQQMSLNHRQRGIDFLNKV